MWGTSEKVGGRVPRVPHQIAPMPTVLRKCCRRKLFFVRHLQLENLQLCKDWNTQFNREAGAASSRTAAQNTPSSLSEAPCEHAAPMFSFWCSCTELS